MNGTMSLGLIPARGGSKGVPGKNIRDINGKPLIAYAVECGLQCSSIDHLIVSTDSENIAAAARKYGADVPFIRPAELAEDTTAMLPVMQHAISEAEKYYKKTVSILILIDPTAPLRKIYDVESAIRILKQKKAHCVVSGNEARRSPYFNMVKIENEKAKLILDCNPPVVRRQDSPKVYDLNTVVWVYTRQALMEEKARIPENTVLYLVPTERAIDLDSEIDFMMLESLLNTNKDLP